MSRALGPDDRTSPVATSGQVHLRLRPSDVLMLKRLSRERDQTLAATVRFLLHHYQRTSTSKSAPPTNA